MPRKIVLKMKISIFFFILSMIIVPSSYTVDWSGDIRLTTDTDGDWMPSITSTTDGEIWVVWRSERTGNYEIFYNVFDGTSWAGEDTQLTNNTSADDYPCITQTSDGEIWVVWTSDRTGNAELFYNVFNGTSWNGEDTQLTNNTFMDVDPCITPTSDGEIWVVWASDRVSNQSDLFYNVFNGTSWNGETRITNDTVAEDWYPSVMQAADGMIWVVFSKFIPKPTGWWPENLYFKQYNGTMWGPDVRFTFENPPRFERHPSIMQSKNGPIWVVWDCTQKLGGQEDIYYKVFNGDMWSYPAKLTTSLSVDLWPSITQAADYTIWVAWGSFRPPDYNFDIYYRTGGVHDVAITEVTTSATVAVRGENVSIEVTAQNQGTTDETFEIQYYVDSTFIGSRTVSLSAGQTQTLSPFHWNTSGAPRGTHVISATATAVLGEIYLPDNSKNASNTVEVRLKGDICGMYDGVLLAIPDGRVGLDDLMAIAMPGHIWTYYPDWDPVWGPACDVNKDGGVNFEDVMVAGLHLADT